MRSNYYETFYKINVFKISQQIQENTSTGIPVISLKIDSSTGVFLWVLQKFSENLFYIIPGRLLLTLHCNSLIKKNLSAVSTIGCLVFFGKFADKGPQFTFHRGCSSFLSTWNLKISECYCKQFQLNQIRSSCIFYQDGLELW